MLSISLLHRYTTSVLRGYRFTLTPIQSFVWLTRAKTLPPVAWEMVLQCSVFSNSFHDPRRQQLHIWVDPILVRKSTLISPRNLADKVPHSCTLTGQRTSAVVLTSVTASYIVPSANSALVDTAVVRFGWVAFHTGHQFNVDVMKEVLNVATKTFVSPACHDTLVTREEVGLVIL